jgi:hypothetical protein
MNINQVFRSGKYAGYTIGEIYAKDRRYINWVLENRPEMLKSHTKKPKETTYKKPTYIDPPDIPKDNVIKGISPNEAFGL